MVGSKGERGRGKGGSDRIRLIVPSEENACEDTRRFNGQITLMQDKNSRDRGGEHYDKENSLLSACCEESLSGGVVVWGGGGVGGGGGGGGEFGLIEPNVTFIHFKPSLG